MPYFYCWDCRTLVPVISDNPRIRVRCPECKEKYPRRLERKRRIYLRLKAELMLDWALRMLEKQEAYLHSYQEAAEIIRERIWSDPEAFKSAHEMVAVMELLRNRVRVKIQQKVAGHRVDILLPEEKAVVEIDDYMHDYKQLEDYQRDINIRKELGPDWEVIRIPTKYIEQKVSALLGAIREIREYKQKIRRQHNGIIPKWFSKRDQAMWKKVERQFRALA